MPRGFRYITWVFFLFWGLFFSGPAGGEASGETVVVIEIDGVIDPGTASYFRYALDEAEALGAAAIILELETPGGFINAAEQITGMMDEYPGAIYAYVNLSAISAGAYLALAADGIFMAPGSTLGAAEPRFLGLGEVDEKELSAWDKKMMAMAERQGRDPEIASAMVRRDLEIEGLVEKGKLLTLTAGEALEVGYSEAVIENRGELLAETGLAGARVVLLQPRITDTLIGWTTSPVVGTLLLMIGLTGLAIEVFTPGVGIAGILSLLAFGLYFGGNIAAGMAEYWVLLFFGFGVALMLIEAFMPGFGVFGIAGLLLTQVAIVLAAASVETGIVMLLVSVFLAALLSVLAFRFFSRRGALRHIILADAETADLGYIAPRNQQELTGKEGVALTTLRPSGTASIDGRRIDVVSEGAFIPAGEALIVDRVEGVRVIVRKADGDSSNR